MSELKIGDTVRILKLNSSFTGTTGTVVSFPQPGLAWVHPEILPRDSEICFKLEELQSLMGEFYREEKDESLEKNRVRGPGGAPTRATTLPNDPAQRKEYPIASGVLDYFPDAIVAISKISKAGNDQHNPGLPLRWTRSKSGDESDTCIRHFLQRGTLDTDGMRHTAKAAWRMLAILQKEIESEQDILIKDRKS